MSICGEITANIERDCDALPVGGVKSVIHVMNLNDIATLTYDANNPLIVTGMTMKVGKQAYRYEVFKRGHRPYFTFVAGEYGGRYRHSIDTSIQVWDNDTKAQVQGLFSSEVVIITENLQSSGDARFEIYGYSNGMSVADGATRNLGENDGVLTYTLQSDDLALEAHPPLSFAVEATGVYSYAATLAAVTALETPAVAPGS